jgi:hypothetical protein
MMLRWARKRVAPNFQKKRNWSLYDDEILRRLYPDCKTADLALYFGRQVDSLHHRAALLGIKKSKEWLASEEGCWVRTHLDVAKASHFQKGRIPWNKGLKHPPGWSPGRMAETQFKKGQIVGSAAQRLMPIGGTRISKDGYLEVKYRDRNGQHGNFKGAHVLLWEQSHGRVKLDNGQVLKPGAKLPKGFAIVFKDGDKTHITLENLELVSRAELMRRNSVHNLPKELAEVIQLAGALKRKIRRLNG